MLHWDGGFALAIASHAKGLMLASPRHGEIQLTPEEFEQAFPRNRTAVDGKSRQHARKRFDQVGSCQH